MRKLFFQVGECGRISSFEVKTGKPVCVADLPVFSTCGIWGVEFYFF
jgi:hypothetical protein